MREIKFRQWTTRWASGINRMIYLGEITDKNFSFMVDGELMQYTGVKDSNGKEIYEFDILSISDREDNQIVYFDNEGCWGTDEFALFELVRSETRIFEVIGNKYENPELL